jgi:hypothetical protein
MDSATDIPQAGWVVPFGNPRVKGCTLLTEAYRSLPRPSSAANAKASTMHPFHLDNNYSASANFDVLHQQNDNVKEQSMSGASTQPSALSRTPIADI